MTGPPRVDRRTALLGLAAGLAAAGFSRAASALARTPATGRLAFSLPWPLDRLDPHDPSDLAAALFAHALVDTAYALEPSGEPYPALAADLPKARGGRTFVRLRPNLTTARGRPLVAADLVFTIHRSRERGGYAYWSDLPTPQPVRDDPLAVSFATTDEARVARTLSSPFFAVVPRSYNTAQPDGTGAFRADLAPGQLALVRNPRAARGASFLEQIVVNQAPDLSSSLRSFEGGQTDLGWLGAGLHTPRPGAVLFDAGSAGFVVLRTGNEVGVWSAPGVAQQLIDALPRERLQHLGIVEPASRGDSRIEWGGPSCQLLYPEGAVQLGEVAQIVASLLTRPGHEVQAAPSSAVELTRRRGTGAYGLMLHLVRAPGGPGLPALVALTATVAPRSAADAVRRPPRLPSFAPELLTRTLRVGVLGELRVTGAVIPDFYLARGSEVWDLGASFRQPTTRRAT